MPDLFECMRIAANEPGSVLLHDCHDPSRSKLFTQPVEWLEARKLSDLPGLFARVQTAQTEGLWAAGYVGYECGYHWEPTAAPSVELARELPLAVFGLYRAPVIPMPGAPRQGPEAHVRDSAFGIGPEAFSRKVYSIRHFIERGETYQVNLTDRFHGHFQGSPHALFARMTAAQPVAYSALLPVGRHTILSASPELFFHLRGRAITMRPMKGTAARGRDAAEDAARMAALHMDEKNRAENVMIVDLQRSDLGRIAETGSVRVQELFAVERLPSLLQMTSTVTAQLRPDVDLYGIFASLFPSGSIVGAPKVRTMQIVRELEGGDRGPYTGAIGFAAPSGEAVFSVAIRTAVLDGDRLSMGVGAGITYDSDPAAEYAECLLKTAFLREPPFELIETMRWESGCCVLLDRHLDRLAASAAYFEFQWNAAMIRSQIEAEGARLPSAGTWKLRCTLDRAGVLAFSRPERVVWRPNALKALLWPEPVHSGDRFLRYKTTRRALYDRAFREASAQGYADALFHNERGVVTEGAIHSIFVRHGSHWRTPPLDAGVLPGVQRAHLLATVPGMEEVPFSLDELLAADEVWLTNAVRGVRVLDAPRTQIIVGAHAMVGC